MVQKNKKTMIKEKGKEICQRVLDTNNLELKLANDSERVTAETDDLVRQTIEAVEVGLGLSSGMVDSIMEVGEKAGMSVGIMESVIQEVAVQSERINKITKGVNKISESAQNNAATAEETAASSEEQSAQSDTLTELVGRFRLK
ncbi:MAG: hypothetical protein ACTTKP_04555 [Catonella sp.]|uniref:hypothetical protein n=1 Tax=Catonella sp. TaxID=2382125 RepID=UPI003FA12CDB